MLNTDPWKHRAENMKCKTCMWFAPKKKEIIPVNTDSKVEYDPVYNLGRCRRHSPTMSGYPVVFVNDWCGDHKLDEEKV